MVRVLLNNMYACVENGEVVWGPHPLPYLLNDQPVKTRVDPEDYETLLQEFNLRPVYQENARPDIDYDIEDHEDHPRVYWDADNEQVVMYYEYLYRGHAKRNMLQKINRKADAELTNVQNVFNLSMLYEYRETEEEATYFLSLSERKQRNAEEEDFPLIAAGLYIDIDDDGSEVETLTDAAKLIVRRAQMLRARLQNVRRKRKQARAAIENTDDLDEAYAIYKNTFSHHNNLVRNPG